MTDETPGDESGTTVTMDTEGLPDDIDLSDHLLDRISEKFEEELGDAEGDHDERD